MPRALRGQLSLRPKVTALDRLRHRARLTGTQATPLAERYLEEGLLMDEFPGIHFVDAPMGRRPAVHGTGLDVWEIVAVLKDNDLFVPETAAYLEVDRSVVEIAVRYYGSNRADIDAWIARVYELNEAEEQKWRAAQRALSA